jgi:proteic killer suppression protein
MIIGIRHKGLRLLFERGDRSKIRPDCVDKAQRFLSLLDQATSPTDCDLPGYRLHRLTGDLEGYWSIWLSRNHRIIFRFQDGDATDVDIVDYH